MQNCLTGSWVALVTPFNDGKIDLPTLEKLVNFQIEKGTNGIVALGSTGEAATLSQDDYALTLSTIVKTAAGRVPVMAGTGSNCTATTIEKTKLAKRLGADYALVVVPFYNKPTPAGQLAHFRAVADEGGLPVVLYNVPGRTGINMSAEIVAELSHHPQIVGIKEASGNLDQMGAIMATAAEGFVLLSGDDSLTVPAMAIGARGVISVTANILPDLVAQMVASALQGDFQKAKDLHYRLRNINKIMFVESNPIPVKSALAQMGLCKEEYHLPLCPLTPANREKVAAALKEFM